MTEAELLEAVRQAARLCGWGTYHTLRSRGSESGFPDLVLWHPRRHLILYRELKAEAGRLTIDQADTLDALHAAGADVGVWRPDDLDRVLALITGQGGPRV